MLKENTRKLPMSHERDNTCKLTMKKRVGYSHTSHKWAFWKLWERGSSLSIMGRNRFSRNCGKECGGNCGKE
jgi:hypothetical protein